MTITLLDVLNAQNRLRPYMSPTPLEAAPGLGPDVWLKLENVNHTHSFKIRGALNATLLLDDAARKRGIVTASSGNHAQAIAYACHLLGLSVKVVMPKHTPRRKVEGTRRYGADVVLFGKDYDQAEPHARNLEREEGRTYVSSYNDPDVIAGAGTIGLEIVTANPGTRRVVVPTSGGGLLSGVALAVKSVNPAMEVIGVNAERAPAMHNVFYDDTLPQIAETLAEALSGDIEGTLTIDLCQRYVDRIVLVSEDDIAEAMRWLVREGGWLVEGGGAVGVAAILSGAIPVDDGPTAVVVSGSNVDFETVQRVIGAGQVNDSAHR